MFNVTTLMTDLIIKTLTTQATMVDLSIESWRLAMKRLTGDVVASETPFDTQLQIMTPLGPIALTYHRDPSPPRIKDIN